MVGEYEMVISQVSGPQVSIPNPTSFTGVYFARAGSSNQQQAQTQQQNQSQNQNQGGSQQNQTGSQQNQNQSGGQQNQNQFPGPQQQNAGIGTQISGRPTLIIRKTIHRRSGRAGKGNNLILPTHAQRRNYLNYVNSGSMNRRQTLRNYRYR